MSEELKLEEQALSQAAEIGITSQLDSVEDINVNVRTDLLKMVQGKADSVSVTGQGLVMEKDIRVQEMELHTSDIGIDVLSSIFGGEIELDHPTDATIRVVLKEADLNRALNSEFVRRKMPSFDLHVDDELVTMKAQHMELQLRGSNQMMFSGDFLVQTEGKTEELSFTASAIPRTDTDPVLLQGLYCTKGKGLSIELAYAFMKKAKELINKPYFEFEGSAFRIKNMVLGEGSLTVEVEAYMRQIPSL